MEDFLTVPHRNQLYKLSYRYRKGTGKYTLVYLHGLGNSKADFDEAYTHTDLRSFSLFAFDFPGCGKSRPYFEETPLAIDDLAFFTHQCIQFVSLQNVVLIGQSLGGLTALWTALHYPDQIAGFINVEGNLGPRDCDIQSRDVFRKQFLGREVGFMDEVVARLLASPQPGFDRFGQGLKTTITPRAYFDYSRSLVDYSDRKPLLQQFIDLSVPRCYLHGDANAQLPQIPRLKEAGIPVFSIPHSDHFPAYSNPMAFYAAISEFINCL